MSGQHVRVNLVRPLPEIVRLERMPQTVAALSTSSRSFANTSPGFLHVVQFAVFSSRRCARWARSSAIVSGVSATVRGRPVFVGLDVGSGAGTSSCCVIPEQLSSAM
jgi:hypothetical protein